jgi:hypothetical protein
MNPGEGDPSQVGIVRLVLRRHKYCNMNPCINIFTSRDEPWRRGPVSGNTPILPVLGTVGVYLYNCYKRDTVLCTYTHVYSEYLHVIT